MYYFERNNTNANLLVKCCPPRNKSCIIPRGLKLMNLNSFKVATLGRGKMQGSYNFKVCGTIGYQFPLLPQDACGAVCLGAPQRATHQSSQQGVIIISFLINDSPTKYERI